MSMTKPWIHNSIHSYCVVSLAKKHLDDSVLMSYLYNVIPNFHLITFTWMNKKNFKAQTKANNRNNNIVAI
ncbi:hypothetical protein DERF_007374 [Dermatophagoides farinae]|uniref:Uncharacterized protein n=1 Tax=Dermatophagoides farinae TaxID=6954 RepID=A0A922L5X7_DERFA|nr:hypothetical protein DERF_007374 [Dermatophagoides farinae]